MDGGANIGGNETFGLADDAARALRLRRSLTGLGLAAAVVLAFAAVHVYSVFFLSIAGTSLPLALALAAVECWLFVGLFIVAHDAMHGSLAPAFPALNPAIGRVILLLYAGFGWKTIRDAHMAHHKAPGTEADPDFFAGDPGRLWPWYGVFMKRYFGLGSGLFIASVVATYILVLGAPISNVVLLYGLPAILSSLQLFYFGTYLPHRHEDLAFSDRHNARTADFGYLASLLTCFHFGYHHEHHVKPGVPWWALPGEHAKAQAKAASRNEFHST